jgi:hypothetical protein
MEKLSSEEIAYELRELTKRTDFDSNVIKVLANAYSHILELQEALLATQREICSWQGLTQNITKEKAAEWRGWNCFTEEYKRREQALDRLAELDQELGL